MNEINKRIKRLALDASPEQQIKIIQAALECGHPAQVEGNLIKPFWMAAGLRDMDLESYNELSDNEKGRLSYLMRLRPGMKWKWENRPIIDTIKNIISPLNSYIKRLNRVVIILQMPGKSVPPHRDLIVGDTYENMESRTSTLWGNKTLQYLGDPWFSAINKEIPNNNLHEKQNYFGLRIPLSQYPGNNGKPYLQRPGAEKQYYNVNNQLFLLDEASTNHGADAVDFYRGVVIVDCELDIFSIQKICLD